MRTIKFRIWFGNKFHYVDFNGVKTSSLVVNISQPADTIWQQFTGLTDKTGKEIYEGDILKLSDGKMGDVYFGSGAFHARKIDCLWFGAKHEVCEDYEILGNIFENPEILVDNKSENT